MIPESIPIVDLSPILGPYDSITSDQYLKVAKDLGDAMSGIGFAYLVNHGVDTKKVDEVYSQSEKFFQLPAEIKTKYKKVNPPEDFHGYTSPGDELLNESEKNSTELREVWDVWGPSGQKDEAYPIKEVPEFKFAFDTLRPELDEVSKKLFKCLAQYLKMDEDFFVKRHKNLGDRSIKCQTQMRSMYYYTLKKDDPIPPNAIRCGEHSDWGSITLLFQDMVGGLEVKTVNGDWVEATPVEGAIILNSGQLMEFWTGGHLHAAHHRVRILDHGQITSKPRQSFIYFVNPDGYEEVFPVVPLKKGKEDFAHRPTLVAYDHYKRLIADATIKGY